MNLRRGVIFYLVLVLIAVSLAGAASVHKAQQVYACTYTVEHTNTLSKAYYSPWLGRNDYLNVRITTFGGVAGSGYQCAQYRYYESQQWTTYGSPGGYFTEVRVWVVSTYEGAWTSLSPTIYTPQFHYPAGAARQADNYSSYFADANGGGNISQYITAG